MKIVLDTNVIISAALTPGRNAGIIFELIFNSEKIELFYCDGILAEYQKVLAKPTLKIPPELQRQALDDIKENGSYILPASSTVLLKHEADRIFYDTAVSSGAILITGNLKHYPDENFILNPADFIAKFLKI